VVLALLLAAILGLLAPGAQRWLRVRLHARPGLIFAVPGLLILLFCGLAAARGAFSMALLALIAAYGLTPAVLASVQGAEVVKRPSWLDFAIILALWLPLEFSAGQHLVPKPAQGFLHSVAYAISILLGLAIFLGFRALPDMKYNLPAPRDLALGLAGFAITAPILMGLGRALDFIPPLHAPAQSTGKIALQFFLILVGTALPEEILFRSLIQNWLMQRYGFTTRMLLLAAFIFGCAHLDNGPQPLPNWRYMILATVAGIGYGKVFQKSGSVFSSVLLHALVDGAKHFLF
jgi:CAAX protease family protein